MTTKTSKLVIAIKIGLACCTANALANHAPEFLLSEASSTLVESRFVSDTDVTGEVEDKKKTEIKTKGIKTKDSRAKDTKNKNTMSKDDYANKDSTSQGGLVALDEAFLLFLAEVEDVDGDLLHPVDVDTELEGSFKTKTQSSTGSIKKVNENKQSDSGNQNGKEPLSKIEVKGNTAFGQKPSAKKVKDDDQI